MTVVEEQAFRAAARTALGRSREIVLVSAEGPEDLEPFTLIAFQNSLITGILIPGAWVTEAGTEDRCRAILRQESKALAGQALD